MHVSSAPFGGKRIWDGRSLCGVPGVSQGVPRRAGRPCPPALPSPFLGLHSGAQARPGAVSQRPAASALCDVSSVSPLPDCRPQT